MIVAGWLRRAGGACALLASVGCAGNVQPPSSLVNATSIALHPAPRSAMHADAGRSSWVVPDARRQNLIYVSDDLTNEVYILSYPAGTLVGQLIEFNQPQGLCSDAQGNVFIANTGASQIVEFPHGGRNVVTVLSDPDGNPAGCAVDPTNGNLAVTNVVSASAPSGNVAIYTKGSGTAVTYAVPGVLRPYFCGYDNKGNLFVDGQTSGGGFGLARLAEGARAMHAIALDQTVEYPGAVQWDGKYIAIGDQLLNEILEFSISGSKGHLENSFALTGARDVIEWWLVRYGSSPTHPLANTVVAPDERTEHVDLYAYPSGGNPKKVLTGFYAPIGATFSIGPKP